MSDGKLTDADGEELTPEVLLQILPPEILPARGFSGSGGNTSREVQTRTSDPISEGLKSAFNVISSCAPCNWRKADKLIRPRFIDPRQWWFGEDFAAALHSSFQVVS
jgi:hypothetical protein